MRTHALGLAGFVLLWTGQMVRAQADADALETSIRALHDEDPYRRLLALQTIGNQGNAARAAVPDVLALLKSEKDRKIRARAGKALAQIGAPALRALAGALADPSPDVRYAAAEAVARFGPDAAVVAPELTKLLSDDNVPVRAAAARALGEIGPRANEALPALADALDDAPAVRSAALGALTGFGPEAVSALCTGLKAKKTSVRIRAAFALGALGPDAEGAVPALLELLEDAEPRVRATAIAALGEIGPGAQQALPALVRCLKDANRGVQYQAIEALAAIGPADVTPLRELLKEKNPIVRASAIYVLGQWGPGARDAVPDLIEALKDRETSNRSLAALSLGQIGPPAKAAASRLSTLRTTSSDSSFRVAASLALARIQPDDPEADDRIKHDIARAFGPPSSATLAQYDPKRQAEIRQFLDFFVWVTSFRFGDGLTQEAHAMVSSLGPDAIPAIVHTLNVLQLDPAGKEMTMRECGGACTGREFFFI